MREFFTSGSVYVLLNPAMVCPTRNLGFFYVLAWIAVKPNIFSAMLLLILLLMRWRVSVYCVGQSNNASKREKVKSVWEIMNIDHGKHGIGI